MLRERCQREDVAEPINLGATVAHTRRRQLTPRRLVTIAVDAERQRELWVNPLVRVGEPCDPPLDGEREGSRARAGSSQQHAYCEPGTGPVVRLGPDVPYV